jgi:lipopolysaccharide/colanic/teichoic acid biosynthesis glycosyltransferase
MRGLDGWYGRRGKRWFDVLVAGGALVALAPVLGGVAWLVRWKLGAPVLFKQRRPGLGGRPFLILKFRTMTDARDAEGKLLPDDVRLTAFGRWLRKTSLDELPELWNVLLGNMSLVGPRPLLMQYLERYDERQALRHDVRPGLTGLAQVRGRNTLDWAERFEFDVWYTENLSLLLDLRILAETVLVALRAQGINEPGKATMTEFRPPEARAS